MKSSQSASRRAFLRSTAVAAAGLGLSCGEDPSVGSQGDAKKPNIVLIMADDLGQECLGCYGGTSYKTPHLDALAQAGIRFTQAYAQPLCTPTRVQLMTGQYNFRNWQAFGIMDPAEKTFGHMMQAAGYKTCISGKWQLYSYNPPDFEPEWRGKGMLPQDAGFDEYFLWHAGHTEDKGSRYADPVVLDNGTLRTYTGKYGPDVYTDYVNDFMERHAEESKAGEPFFVYYSMALPHGPFVPTPHSPEWEADGPRRKERGLSQEPCEQAANPAPGGSDEPDCPQDFSWSLRHKGDARYYHDMVEYMDHVIGRIVQKIDELGIRENTLILYYSDNGTPRQVESRMGERVIKGGKGHTTDAGTHVPLIASWKGVCAEGVVNDNLIDSTDFLPTIAEAGGAKPLEGMVVDGRSFLPQLRGEQGHPREWVMFHFDPLPGANKVGYKLVRFARDKRYKLYEENGDLYDVPADPLEEKPIPVDQDTPESAAARRKLRAVLEKMQA
jgi:arylsulfatase A-like enzyme